MAKRTKLTAPSADDLAKLDADFRSENRTRPNPATAPIASVAAEAALTGDAEPAQQKLNRLDAETLREAQEQGRLIVDLPIDQIDEASMVRDRTLLEKDELDELQASIAANGLRLPIEVYKTEDGYGLLSGYRRLLAMRNLHELTNMREYATIKALVRPATDAATAFAAMVEENEVRANLSHFERGRIAVIAAKQGAFTNTEEAINALFASGSAAKRSKVKSFAEVFEYLGDMLKFPEDLTERRGLRLATALRQGGEGALRDALEIAGRYKRADEEWAALEPVVEAQIEGTAPVTKRGRPKAPPVPGWHGDTLQLSNGISLRKESDSHGYFIRVQGKHVTADLLEGVMEHVQFMLEKPKR